MPPEVFDRAALRRRRNRVAQKFVDHDFLVRQMADRLMERLGDIRRRFDTALLLGCHTGQIKAKLPRDQVETVIQADLAEAMVSKADGPRVVLDEEALPFGFDRFDLVIATGNLHLVNDLPGCLIQIRYALKPDGLFLAALPGGRTLHELRHCLSQAEAQITSREALPPRIAPFIDVPEAGALMQRTGYALPVVDIDTLTVFYRNPMRLLQDLQGMAETNIRKERSPLRRDVLMETCRQYQETFADEHGRMQATFQLLMITAWSPGPGQPKPLKRGSGKASLAKALRS